MLSLREDEKAGRAFFLALEEIIGPQGLEAVLEAAGVSDCRAADRQDEAGQCLKWVDIQRALSALSQVFGSRGGCGLAWRAGRAAFKYSLSLFRDEIGLDDSDFRLLPWHKKMRLGLTRLMSFFSRLQVDRISMDEDEHTFIWHIHNGLWERDETSRTIFCSMLAGFIQECMSWIGGSKFFRVEQASSHTPERHGCTIVIYKKPLD